MTTNEPPPYPGDSNPASNDLPSYGSVPVPPSEQPPAATPTGSVPPPPPGGTPPPLVPGGSSFSAGDAIGYGWRKFGQNAGPILLATLLLIVASIAVSAIAGAITGSGFDGTAMTTDGGSIGFSAGGLVAQIITSVVGFIIGAGITRGALDITEGRKFNLAAAFGKLNLGNVLLTSLLVGIVEAIGFALLFIPGVIVAFFTIFAVYFVVDKDTSPIESVTSSFNLIKANAGDTILMILLSIAVVILGVIALCVGIFVAIPVVTIGWAYAYKTFLGEPVAA
ncbi:MAG: hypothetical protein JWR83_2993 [Aeromicrobium sp.]|nr:hypothetical protein [Aeromicrobium sp.]